MPELPEIEHLKRTLEPYLLGARVLSVRLHRRDIVRRANSRRAVRGVKPRDLLVGQTIQSLIRRGKSLAIVGDRGAVLGLHMGMTGQMLALPAGARLPIERRAHVHCEWLLGHPRRASRPFRLIFRDPRRFGGLWPFASMDDLIARAWSRLGPDALTIEALTLRERLLRTSQPIKAALLNQALIAGIGNIYADESLYAAGIHPLARPRRLSIEQWSRLARAIAGILSAAVEAGGSTINDYRDAGGEAGSFAGQHQVYGRADQPCRVCRAVLRSRVIAQRTTVFCDRCQRRS